MTTGPEDMIEPRSEDDSIEWDREPCEPDFWEYEVSDDAQ